MDEHALRTALDAYRAALMEKYAETEELKALYDKAISEPFDWDKEIAEMKC